MKLAEAGKEWGVLNQRLSLDLDKGLKKAIDGDMDKGGQRRIMDNNCT